jgi:lambda repressor-like predicted transcriptional regulator
MAGQQMHDAVAERVGAAIATSGHTLEEVADQAGMRRMVLRRHLAAPERSISRSICSRTRGSGAHLEQRR